MDSDSFRFFSSLFQFSFWFLVFSQCFFFSISLCVCFEVSCVLFACFHKNPSAMFVDTTKIKLKNELLRGKRNCVSAMSHRSTSRSSVIYIRVYLRHSCIYIMIGSHANSQLLWWGKKSMMGPYFLVFYFYFVFFFFVKNQHFSFFFCHLKAL